MMYVSGETAEPPVETTSIIEDIVRQQVIELVRLPLHPLSSPLILTLTAAKLHRTRFASRF
jgi:hypothetical protein